MADHGSLDGTVDSAAAAIQALMDGGAPPADGVEPSEEQETEDTAAAIEAQAEQPPAEEAETPEEQNTVEDASVEETPDEPAPAEPTPPPVQAQAPQPVIPATQVAAAPAASTPTAKDQLDQLNQLVPLLQGHLSAAFPDIKNDDDFQRVALEDPARAIAFQAAERKVQSALKARDNAQTAYRGEWLASQTAELHKRIPEMADPQKGPALGDRMIAYAKSLGYTAEQIQWASAADVVMLHKAMMADEGMKAAEAKAAAAEKALEQAKKKAAVAPPVQKPGAVKPATGKEDKLKELEARAEKTGRLDDVEALLAYRETHPRPTART